MAFTALDIIAILLVGGGLVLGVMRGFVSEVLSLLAWGAAIAALRFLHGPVTQALVGPVGTSAGASVLAFVVIFAFVFIAGKILSRRLGKATRKSVIGPVDRVLGGGFGALKGLIFVTLLYMAANLFYDTIYGRGGARPDWMAKSQSYPLLHASGEAIVDLVEARRGAPPPQEAGAQAETNGLQNAQ
jgi:membrane protein required for colicin V production